MFTSTSSLASSTAPSAAPSARLERGSLLASVLAVGGGVVTAALLGLSIGPLEAAHGRYLADTPTWYRGLALVLAGSHVLWALIGLAGLVLAILALARGARGARAVGAIVLAVAGPFLALAVLMGSLAIGAALA